MPHRASPTSNPHFSLARWLERQWYRLGPWHIALLPLSFLFWLIAWLRRLAYEVGLIRVIRLPVPVVVVGNVTVGGSGKTPLVLWLADKLRAQGFSPGIISRGYGGRLKQVSEVRPDSDPALTGDEPVLLAKKSACPVWVGADRVAAAQALLQARPTCDVIISDDGLQHYRLARDVEIVVVDGVRRFGNGLPLPAGPLREMAARVASVDAVVVNGGSGALPKRAKQAFMMQLKGDMFQNLVQPARLVPPGGLPAGPLHAVAGIGYPARFFEYLQVLGLRVEPHAFADHHAYLPGELDFSGQVLMTEKDAVKCVHFARDNFWALAVRAEISDDLARLVADKLRKSNGQQTT